MSLNTIAQGLVGSENKPSFLLWDKVYHRLSSEEEETWFSRALCESFKALKVDINKLNHLRSVILLPPLHPRIYRPASFRRHQFGQAFLHLAGRSEHLEVRKTAVEALEKLHASMPEQTSTVLRMAISKLLEKESNDSTDLNVDDTGKQRLYRNIIPVLISCGSFAEEADSSEKERLLADLVVVAHHPALSKLLVILSKPLN